MVECPYCGATRTKSNKYLTKAGLTAHLRYCDNAPQIPNSLKPDEIAQIINKCQDTLKIIGIKLKKQLEVNFLEYKEFNQRFKAKSGHAAIVDPRTMFWGHASIKAVNHTAIMYSLKRLKLLTLGYFKATLLLMAAHEMGHYIRKFDHCPTKNECFMSFGSFPVSVEKGNIRLRMNICDKHKWNVFDEIKTTVENLGPLL